MRLILFPRSTSSPTTFRVEPKLQSDLLCRTWYIMRSSVRSRQSQKPDHNCIGPLRVLSLPSTQTSGGKGPAQRLCSPLGGHCAVEYLRKPLEVSHACCPAVKPSRVVRGLSEEVTCSYKPTSGIWTIESLLGRQGAETSQC